MEAGYSPEMAMPIEELNEDLMDIGAEILRRHRKLLPADLVVHQALAQGDAARQVVDQAVARGADLIVMGTHGRGRFAQFLIGSTAESVIRMSQCPVLTIAHEPCARGGRSCVRAEEEQTAMATTSLGAST